jgi:hypothetical protein
VDEWVELIKGNFYNNQTNYSQPPLRRSGRGNHSLRFDLGLGDKPIFLILANLCMGSNG